MSSYLLLHAATKNHLVQSTVPKKNKCYKHSATAECPKHLPSSASVLAGAYTAQKVAVSLQVAGYRRA